MIKNILLVFLCLVSLTSFAQRRNNFQILGFSYDTWANVGFEKGDIAALTIGRATYILGYERLIGNRISVGASYNHIFSSNKVDIRNNGSNYAPIQFNSSEFTNGEYTSKGYTLGYESKYFFEDFDNEGANSWYLGFNYQYTSISERFDNVTYYPSISPNSDPKFEPQDFGLNRFGVKCGYATTLVATAQMGIGVFYNTPSSNNDKFWKSPVDINNLSFNIYLIYGFAL